MGLTSVFLTLYISFIRIISYDFFEAFHLKKKDGNFQRGFPHTFPLLYLFQNAFLGGKSFFCDFFFIQKIQLHLSFEFITIFIFLFTPDMLILVLCYLFKIGPWAGVKMCKFHLQRTRKNAILVRDTFFWGCMLRRRWLVSLVRIVIQETSRSGTGGTLQAPFHHSRVLSGFDYEPHRSSTG